MSINLTKDWKTISMYDLVWEGTYGYGDAVSCITNALWRNHIASRSNTKVLVQWHTNRKWYPPQRKYHPDDPETIIDRWNIIKDYFIGGEQIDYMMGDLEYQGNERDRPRFKHRWNVNQWWSTLWDHKFEMHDGGYICVWIPSHNVDDLTDEFGTRYKDPLSAVRVNRDDPSNQWPTLISSLEKQGAVKYIHYRMPVEEVFKTVAGASICYGYEGIGQVIAKNMWKPMVTYSDLTSVSSRTGAPWQTINHRVTDDDVNVDWMIDLQKKMIGECRNNYKWHREHKK